MTPNNPAKTIVLFDDDPTMRTLLETLLTMEGFIAKSYVEKKNDDFLDYLKTEMPDVLLLDVHLTYSSGVDLLAQIKQDQQLKSVRVLMSSGMDLKDVCLKTGADGFLLKPYMPDELLALLNEITDRAADQPAP